MSTPASSKPSLIWVEGNIASGKSTLCEEFAKDPDNAVVMEEMPSKLLAMFYANQPKYAFPFQLHTVESRLHALEIMQKTSEHDHKKRVILDRSALGDSVFMLAQMVSGSADMNEYEAYREIMGWSLMEPEELRQFLSKYNPKVVFLWETPENCAIRAEKRDRAIPLDYLRLIESVHFYALLQLAEVWPVHLVVQREGQSLQASQEIAKGNMEQILSSEPPASIRFVKSTVYATDPKFENSISFPEGLDGIQLDPELTNATVVVPRIPPMSHLAAASRPASAGGREAEPVAAASASIDDVMRRMWSAQAIHNAILLLRRGCELVLVE